MGRIIDITDKLTNEKPMIKIGVKTYPVDNTKNTMMRVNAVFKKAKDEIDGMDAALKLFLGEQAFEEICSDGITMNGYKALFTAVNAAVTEEDFEAAEARFQKAGK